MEVPLLGATDDAEKKKPHHTLPHLLDNNIIQNYPSLRPRYCRRSECLALGWVLVTLSSGGTCRVDAGLVRCGVPPLLVTHDTHRTGAPPHTSAGAVSRLL